MKKSILFAGLVFVVSCVSKAEESKKCSDDLVLKLAKNLETLYSVSISERSKLDTLVLKSQSEKGLKSEYAKLIKANAAVFESKYSKLLNETIEIQKQHPECVWNK